MKLSLILKKISSVFQTSSASFKQHNAQYEEEGKLEKEKKIIEQNEKEDVFNNVEYRLTDFFNEHPQVRGIAVDIGSGTGWFSSKFSKLFKKVISIEPSAKAIEIAKTFYSIEQYPNIEWKNGLAEQVLKGLRFDEPAFFLTGVVLSHLRDKEVAAICAQVNRLSLPGSLLCFNECWGPEHHQIMWHVRTKEWWQQQLPGWDLNFFGPEVQNVPGRHKGIHGIKKV